MSGEYVFRLKHKTATTPILCMKSQNLFLDNCFTCWPCWSYLYYRHWIASWCEQECRHQWSMKFDFIYHGVIIRNSLIAGHRKIKKTSAFEDTWGNWIFCNHCGNSGSHLASATYNWTVEDLSRYKVPYATEIPWCLAHLINHKRLVVACYWECMYDDVRIFLTFHDIVQFLQSL